MPTHTHRLFLLAPFHACAFCFRAPGGTLQNDYDAHSAPWGREVVQSREVTGDSCKPQAAVQPFCPSGPFHEGGFATENVLTGTFKKNQSHVQEVPNSQNENGPSGILSWRLYCVGFRFLHN